MGTSLSGLTPATTFDGLLKTSDNDPIGAALKTIGTGDGTDSVLQLSNSALQIGGTFNVDGGIATFKGVGSSHLTSSFIIKNSADAEIFRVRDDAQIFAEYINGLSVSASAYALYGADYAPNIRVNIKGSGATSATTALLVQNSAGAQLIKARDDSQIQLGQSSNFTIDGVTTYNRYGLVVGSTSPESNTRLFVKGSGNDATTTALLVQNSDGAELLSLDDVGGVRLGGDGNTTTKANIKLDAYSGLFNVTAAKFGNWNGSVYAVFSGLAKTDALFAFGNDVTTASTRMHIKGLGATSATTALLVQNSAGTDLLKVLDDGQLTTKTINTSNSNIVAGTGIVYSKGFVAKSIFAFSNKKVFNVSEPPTVGTSGDASVFTATLPYAPTSGNETLTILNASPTINQTGGANGITRGLYVNPTLTSAADFRAIETTAGNVVFGNLPTSATGLPTGAIYNDAGTLKIV